MIQSAAFWSLLNKEIKRFLKVSVQTVLTPLVNSSLYLLIFGVSLGSKITLDHPFSYLEFLIPGLIMMSCLNNAFQNSSSSIISAKASGDLEDLKVVPISILQIIAAYAVGGVVRGLMVATITAGVGAVFMVLTVGHGLQVAHPLWLLYFLILGGLSFALLGVTAAFWARSFDHMAGFNSFILLPLIYLGGVFFSIQVLHPFWQQLAMWNPLLYFINGVRFGFLGVADVDHTRAAIVTLLTLLSLYVIAYRTLKKASFLRW